MEEKDYEKLLNHLSDLANQKDKHLDIDDVNAVFDQADPNFNDAINDLESRGITIDYHADIDDVDFDDEVSEDVDLVALEEDEEDLDKEIANFDTLPSSVKVDDHVKMYLKEIGKIPLLTYEEELKLAKKIEEGKIAEKRYDEEDNLSDEEAEQLQAVIDEAERAKNRLVEANLRLVVSNAKKFMNRGLHLLDLIQEGNMGLMKAVDKFDYNK